MPIQIPSQADLGGVADEVADAKAQAGDPDARQANAIVDLATQAAADIAALQGGGGVTGINGASVPAAGALTTGNVLKVSGASALSYGPVNLAGGADHVTGVLPNANIATATAGATGAVQLAGDLAGSGSAAATPRVGAVNSATVPAAGALTTGNVLQVSGASALSYAPINLAGGAGYVTGVLPSGNMAGATAGAPGTVQLAGDLAGSGSASATPRVGAINGATVPAGGALGTGNVLQVSAASSLTYGAVNLAGGGNYVTGVLPFLNTHAQAGTVHTVRGVVTTNVANLASFAVAGHDGLTFIQNDRVLLVAQTTGAENGIYTVGAVAGGNAALTRATDWTTSLVLPAASSVKINDGATWRHREWITTVVGTVTVGTTSPAFYPRAAKGVTVAMTAGSVTVSNVWLLSTTSHISATVNTAGGTQGHLSVPVASVTAGAGTGSFTITSSSNTDTSTINWLIVN